MRSVGVTLAFLWVLAQFAGCASTEVTQQMVANNEPLARPHQIWVYDFTATPAEATSNSSNGNEAGVQASRPTAQQLQSGRKLGALIANDLVVDIRAMGLSAAKAGESSPQVGDDVIRGYVVLVEEGGIAKRFIVGFGAGTSEIDTVAEEYQMTAEGLHKLESWKLDSAGGKTPGIVVPAAMAVVLSNPLGLILASGMKIYGEVSGINTVDGRAKATADKIADKLSITFHERNWIS
jgi:hypothetical protein